MSDLVYILTNPTMPDLIKIGQTDDLEKRVKSLSSHSGIPVAFEVYYCCEVEDGPDVERRLHSGFGDYRINLKREFFRVNPERVKIILEGWSIKDATPEKDFVESQEEQNSLNREQERERSRRSHFTFSEVNIPIGSKLVFIRDETKIAFVTGDKEIEFEGTKSSLSEIALGILTTCFGWKGETCRGPNFWVFENETLTDRRIRMENSGEF